MVKSVSKRSIKNSFFLVLKVALICGVFFFIVNGHYSIKSLLINVGVSLMYAFGLGFGQGYMNDWLSKKWDWITQTNKRVFIGVVFTLLYTIPVILLMNYILFVKIQGVDAQLFLSKQFIWTHLFWIVFSLMISAFFHARGFMIAWKETVENQSQLEAKKATVQFQSLKNQLDPHFLFNSLNVLTSLIGENPQKAEQFTTKLSRVYRYVLEQKNNAVVPLQEEINFAKSYMELLQMRFEDAVQFEFDEDLATSEAKIAPLTLQLLLENAVKHNAISSEKQLKIAIEKQANYLVVRNNVNKKMVVEKSTNVGLQHIKQQYKALSKNEVEVIANAQFFEVKIPLL